MPNNLPSGGGVRNLLAMFESGNINKTVDKSPPRGRSPASSSDASSSNRPLSKIRTSFIAVERNSTVGAQLGLKKAGEGSSASSPAGTSHSSPTQEKGSEPNHTSPALSSPISLRSTSSRPLESVKEEKLIDLNMMDGAVESLNRMTEIAGRHSPKTNDNAEVALATGNTNTMQGTGQKSSRVGNVLKSSAFDKTPSPKGSEKSNSPSDGKPSLSPSPLDAEQPAKVNNPDGPTTPTSQTDSIPPEPASKVSHASSVKSPAVASINATSPRKALVNHGSAALSRKSPKSPHPPKTPTSPRHRRQQSKSSTPKQTSIGKHSPHSSTTSAHTSPKKSSVTPPIHKPRPKSPTRPVHVPAHLMAPTASSAAKNFGAAAPPPPATATAAAAPATVTATTTAAAPAPARASSRAGISRTSTELKRKTSTTHRSAQSAYKTVGPPPARSVQKRTSHSSLNNQPTTTRRPSSERPRSRISTSGARPIIKAPDEGFLARMMRPTASSASKAHDKVDAKTSPKTRRSSSIKSLRLRHSDKSDKSKHAKTENKEDKHDAELENDKKEEPVAEQAAVEVPEAKESTSEPQQGAEEQKPEEVAEAKPESEAVPSTATSTNEEATA